MFSFPGTDRNGKLFEKENYLDAFAKILTDKFRQPWYSE